MNKLTFAHAGMGPGAEFDTIRALVERWGKLAVDIGDDAALLQTHAGRTHVVSTDASIEDIHFRDAWISPFDVGARATAAALSDLAAMGARAEAILIAFTVPERWRAHLLDVADGIASTLGETGGRIVGGNISRSATFGITTTVIGSAARVVRRAGARIGDRLLVTGTLGGPARALQCWREGVPPDSWSRMRFARPLPRLAEGEWFAESGVHAMLDISDGLVADARHMATASNVALQLDAMRVPRGDGISIDEALSSGEEYELLLACAPALAARLLAESSARGFTLTDIGEVVEGAPGVHVVAPASRRVVEFAPGHDHFSS